MTEGERCRNCDAPAGPAYCGACGQALDERRGPLLGLVRDLLSEWFALDGRLARTIAALAVPGELTRANLAGRRATFLAPMRLYAVASLALFSTALSLRTPQATDVGLYINDRLVTDAPSPAGVPSYSISLPDRPAFGWLGERSVASVERMQALPPQQVFDSLFGGMRRVLPVVLILLVLYLALGLKILFWRQRVLYVDHLLFALHTQSAVFVFMAGVWLATVVSGMSPMRSLIAYVALGLLFLPAYMLLAMRRVYRQSWLWCAVKTAVLSLFFFIGFQITFGVSIGVIALRI